MKGILADVNIEGYVDLLVAMLRAEPWKIFWDDLQLQYVVFANIGLAPESPDLLVWKTCQERELLLITDNRNKDDTDSLEATIREQNTPSSLPVFTIADVPHLRHSKDYADQIIEAFLIYVLQGDNIRGTGRLYLP